METESPSSTPTAAPSLTVSELTFKIKNQLELAYPSVSVQGELSNCKKHSSGHLYFTLKDEAAQLQVALFHPMASRLGFEPKDGDKVIVRGQISVYSQRGSYQLTARHMEKIGLGELLIKLEALKKELKALGWFNPEIKKKIPPSPKKIGVITSPTGAVIRDIINVLSHRHPGFHLILYPTRVQGETAAKEIAKALEYFNYHNLCEVIIIARGGGSFEDLMPFNERSLLEAVHASHIPIISAVGHETDFTLCDFVADMRAPTPSAAAERVLPSKKEQQKKISLIRQNLQKRIESLLQSYKLQLGHLKKHQILADPLTILHARQQFLDNTVDDLTEQMKHLLEKSQIKLKHYKERLSVRILLDRHLKEKQRLEITKRLLRERLSHLISKERAWLLQIKPQIEERLKNLCHRRKETLRLYQNLISPQRLKEILNREKARLEAASQILKAHSPQTILQKGYAILKRESESKKKGLWEEGEILVIETQNQHLKAQIKHVQFKSGCVKGQYQLFD